MHPSSATLINAAASVDPSVPVAVSLGSFALFVILYLWTAVALSAVFGKSGVDRWKAWVPVLNTVTLLELGGLSGWLLLFLLIPGLGVLILWVIVVIACYRVNISFGFGAGMTVLAALSIPIWASVVGFGSARWIGAGPVRTPSASTGPRRSADASSPPAPQAPRTAVAAPDPLAQRLAPVIPPMPPLPAPTPSRPGGFDHGGFDLGAAGELTSDVTDAVPGAPAPVSAVSPVASPPAAPVWSVPGAPVAAETGSAAWAPPPVTRVPAAPPQAPATEPWAPRRSTAPDASDHQGPPESSAEVSAIAGAPDAGSPRSARASVSALHTAPEIPDEPVDQTIITRRKRTAWSLILPAGAAVPLSSHTVIVGRKPSADAEFPGAQLVSVDDGTVSKTHARLAMRDERWYITDLGSTNGVLFATLMGTEIEAAPGVEVEAGERFFLGDAEVRLQRSDG